MARNDQVLIDGIIDDRVANTVPAIRRDEAFELFAFEQLLKFADLSSDELKSGWVDGGDDGGIDGFFLFVNDHLLSDASTFGWPKSRADLSVWIVNCKHHDTFSQAPVDKLIATLSELLDLGTRTSELASRYSREILAARDRLIFAYRLLATKIESFSVTVAYASRGDTANIGAAVSARAAQLEDALRNLFSGIEVAFRFVGASELIAMHRKARRYSLALPFVQCFSHGERYVLLANLAEYARFVTEEDGSIRRYLFDSNVRDFAGLNRVNEDIASSLRAEGGPDFWWMNNGVTILVTNAMITGEEIVLDDVQIVNGLQTTESIFRYFASGGIDAQKRAVLVKVVKSSDPSVRDAIIRATNNQTEVEQQSLHATDKIQRDIEQVLLGADWYYDRRKNFYANQGVAAEKIVSPLYLAAAVVGVVRAHPSVASRLKQRHLRNPQTYANVFSESLRLEVWPTLVSLLKFVDLELERQRGGNRSHGEHFYKRWRYIASLILAARSLKTFAFSDDAFSALDVKNLNSARFDEVWMLLQDVTKTGIGVGGKRGVAVAFVRTACEEASRRFNIDAVGKVESSPNKFLLERSHAKPSNFQRAPRREVPPEFLELVDAALPPQPWKPGIQKLVAGAIGARPGEVSRAIRELMASGRRHRQKDGVVFTQMGG